MTMVLGLLILAAATGTSTSSVERFLPCAAGLTVVYATEGGGRVTERVRGPGGEPNGCVVERTVGREGDTKPRPSTPYLREHLPMKISYAGELDMPLAFRPPLLRGPLEKGRRWRFNTTRYEIEASGLTQAVKAGTFADCVRIRETSEDGSWTLTRVYAPSVGLILSEGSGGRLEALSVSGKQKP